MTAQSALTDPADIHIKEWTPDKARFGSCFDSLINSISVHVLTPESTLFRFHFDSWIDLFFISTLDLTWFQAVSTFITFNSPIWLLMQLEFDSWCFRLYFDAKHNFIAGFDYWPDFLNLSTYFSFWFDEIMQLCFKLCFNWFGSNNNINQ